jgi:hypothetical protein
MYRSKRRVLTNFAHINFLAFSDLACKRGTLALFNFSLVILLGLSITLLKLTSFSEKVIGTTCFLRSTSMALNVVN